MTVTAKPDFKEAENLLTPDRIAEMTANGKIGEFVKDYADAKMAALGADIESQIKDQMESTVRDYIKDNGGKPNRPGVANGQEVKQGNRMAIARGRGAV